MASDEVAAADVVATVTDAVLGGDDGEAGLTEGEEIAAVEETSEAVVRGT